MDEQRKLAFEFARDTVKQLITLGTAIVALSVTFSKDVVGAPSAWQEGLLVGSWIGFLLSIIFGVWALLALTGSLEAHQLNGEDNPPEKPKDGGADAPSIYGLNITLPSLLQIVAFLIALGLTIWFGVESLATESNISIQPTR